MVILCINNSHVRLLMKNNEYPAYITTRIGPHAAFRSNKKSWRKCLSQRIYAKKLIKFLLQSERVYYNCLWLYTFIFTYLRKAEYPRTKLKLWFVVQYIMYVANKKYKIVFIILCIHSYPFNKKSMFTNKVKIIICCRVFANLCVYTKVNIIMLNLSCCL